MIKIAIQLNNRSFAERWVNYCNKKNIECKIVNAYNNDVIEQVKDCDAFMWHFHHADYRDMQFAKSLLYSLQQKGIKVFPDFNTCWHFDDKIAQKYLLEAIDAPLVPSYVFYTEKEAMEWIKKTTFPKVFKLKGGAGASNVKLVKTKKDAKKLIRRSFGKGFRQYRFWEKIKEEYRRYCQGSITLREFLRPIYYQITKRYPSTFDHYHGKEIGYAYFQEFIPNNNFDIRICIVGNKAFGLKRYTRNNDFRASGSGKISYTKADIDDRCVRISFDIAKKLKTLSIAFDFIFDMNQNPLIVEISYGYAVSAYNACEGYWTDDMQWHEGSNFDFCGWMVENLINDIKKTN